MRGTFVSLGHPPSHAQVYFGEAVGMIGGVRQKIRFLCMDLPQSDACWSGKKIARHRRCYGEEAFIADPLHSLR